jgi:hypothetical protein
MKTRQRNPREALLLALHVEIVRSTHESYELRDHMTCSTNTYDCHWEPSPFYAVGLRTEPIELEDEKWKERIFLHAQSSPHLIRLEWCPRCRLVRIPEEARP